MTAIVIISILFLISLGFWAAYSYGYTKGIYDLTRTIDSKLKQRNEEKE